jgi:hypothetical protein
VAVYAAKAGWRALEREHGVIGSLIKEIPPSFLQTVELPYSTPWFDVPPAAPFGHSPRSAYCTQA